MIKLLYFLKNILIFGVLTILTQVGGIIYFLHKPISWVLKKRFPNAFLRFFAKVASFTIFYSIISLTVVPIIAIPTGRVPLPMFSSDTKPIAPRTILTVLTNRHYVKLKLRKEVYRIALEMKKAYPENDILYLDANFPFINGFPLLPHLSHDDGEKLDLEFFYKNAENQEAVNSSPSWCGYGIFEAPTKGENNQPEICKDRGYWQYDVTKYLVSQNSAEQFLFDEVKTRHLIKLFAESPKIGKIFLEPHLKNRLKLRAYNKIRFHGCQAVRHDDHIHIQL